MLDTDHLDWDALLDAILEATREGRLKWQRLPLHLGIAVATMGEWELLFWEMAGPKLVLSRVEGPTVHVWGRENNVALEGLRRTIWWYVHPTASDARRAFNDLMKRLKSEEADAQ